MLRPRINGCNATTARSHFDLLPVGTNSIPGISASKSDRTIGPAAAFSTRSRRTVGCRARIALNSAFIVR